MRPLESRPLFTAVVEVGKIQSLGPMEARDRRVIPITGGTITGERVSGRIVSGGADWQTLWSDGLAEIEARYMMETVDGAHVLIHSTGTRHGPAEVVAALGRGEAVDPALYYFRTALRFETGDARYRWLSRLLAIGIGRREAGRVVIDAWEIL